MKRSTRFHAMQSAHRSSCGFCSPDRNPFKTDKAMEPRRALKMVETTESMRQSEH